MRRIVLVVALTSVARVVAAQAPATGRLEGAVADSVHARPLAGTVVSATLLASARDTTFVATTDKLGHFRFEPLPAGRYAVTFASALLDSLEFGGPVSQVSVAPGSVANVDLAIPSRSSLVNTACPGLTLPEKTGALLGLVRDADGERPIGGAQVAVAWSALDIDTTSHTVATEERSARAVTDASGQYHLCGVPTQEWLVLQVQHEGRAGPVLRAYVPDAAGVAVRNLSFSPSTARSLAVAADTAVEAMARGSASLVGTVRSTTGQPVRGAEVRVLNTAPTAHTDEQGAFTLAALPSGTYELEVRQLGFGIVRQPVELRSGRSTRADVALERVVALDSMNLVVRRAHYPEFEKRRAEAVSGRFLDELEIERLHAPTTSDVISTIPGLRIVGQGPSARVVTGRGSSMSCSSPLVLIDDMPATSVNELPSSQLGAIEFYPGSTSAPMTHRSPCGTIMIWSKR
jgi:hypothetical protein